MKLIVTSAVIFFDALSLLQSRTYDKEMLAPLSNCADALNISYTSTAKSLLRANCFTCYGDGSGLGNVLLETYDEVKVLASNDRLLSSVSHTAGIAAIPLGADKLSERNIQTIKTRVEQGNS